MKLNMLNILSDFGDGIVEAILGLIWQLLTGLMSILDHLQSAFFFLTGAEKMNVEIDGQEVSVTLLELMFGITTKYNENGEIIEQGIDFSMPLHGAYIKMLGVFAIVFVFFIICAIIKIQISRESREFMPSMKKMLWKSGVAFFIVLILPIIFCVLLSFSGIFMETVISLFRFELLEGNDKLSISDCLFRASVIGSKTATSTPVSYRLGDGSIKSYKVIMVDYGENFSMVLLTISVTCCLVGIGMSVLTVAERLINIALLYIISPFVVASIPLDDGRRWDSWKDIATVKILTASANVISIYIFIYLLTVFGEQILKGDVDSVLSIVYIVIAISGSFGCAKASTLIASIISANAGQQEGMSFMGNQAMLNMAGKVAGGVLGTATHLAGLSYKASGISNTLNSNNAQSTAYTKEDSQIADLYNKNPLTDVVPTSTSEDSSESVSKTTSKKLSARRTMKGIASAPKVAFKVTNAGVDMVGKGLRGAKRYASVPGIIKLGSYGVATGVALGVGAGVGTYKAGRKLVEYLKNDYASVNGPKVSTEAVPEDTSNEDGGRFE